MRYFLYFITIGRARKAGSDFSLWNLSLQPGLADITFDKRDRFQREQNPGPAGRMPRLPSAEGRRAVSFVSVPCGGFYLLFRQQRRCFRGISQGGGGGGGGQGGGGAGLPGGGGGGPGRLAVTRRQTCSKLRETLIPGLSYAGSCKTV